MLITTQQIVVDLINTISPPFRVWPHKTVRSEKNQSSQSIYQWTVWMWEIAHECILYPSELWKSGSRIQLGMNPYWFHHDLWMRHIQTKIRSDRPRCVVICLIHYVGQYSILVNAVVFMCTRVILDIYVWITGCIVQSQSPLGKTPYEDMGLLKQLNHFVKFECHI
jgi:hypothetical protein